MAEIDENPQTISLDAINQIWIWSVVGTALSCAGFLFILVTFIGIPTLRRKVPCRMVMNLAVMDFILSLCGIVNSNAQKFDIEHHNLCVTLGVIRSYTGLASSLWILMFSITMYEFMFKDKYKLSFRSEVRNYIVCYILPIFPTFIPLFFDAYGNAGTYCWIKQGSNMLGTMIILQIPVTLIIMGVLLVYVTIACKLRHVVVSDSIWKLMLQFALYPIGLILCTLCSWLNRYYNQSFMGGSIVWISIVHVFVRQSQVLVNALIYGLNPTVRHQIKTALSKVTKSLRKKSQEEEVSYLSIQSTFISSALSQSLAKPENMDY